LTVVDESVEDAIGVARDEIRCLRGKSYVSAIRTERGPEAPAITLIPSAIHARPFDDSGIRMNCWNEDRKKETSHGEQANDTPDSSAPNRLPATKIDHSPTSQAAPGPPLPERKMTGREPRNIGISTDV
jgi:hypothetical protein